MIRGFEANRVLVVIGDVRMNNLIYRAGHLQNVITVDPNIPGPRRGLVQSFLNRLADAWVASDPPTYLGRFSTDGTLLAKGSGMMRYASSQPGTDRPGECESG